MFKKTESTRLGEILVSKGIITSEQLAIATHEQTKRKRLLKPTDKTGYASRATLLGEILIELGFIDQLELKRGLNWQERLRHVSIAMALCAPFMTFLPSMAAAATSSSSSSSFSSANSQKSLTPTTIQAEDYSLMKGVSNEPTTDVGGGQNTRYIDTNDWMTYGNSAVYIPVTGTYQITFRVASVSANGILALKEASTDATLDTIPIPNTGKLQTWVDVVRTVKLTQGTHTFKLFAINGSFNINWFRVEAVSTPMPLTIQAESYSLMKGVSYETTSDTGGGTNVRYIDALDWMAYDNVDVVIPTTASYKITYRVASLLGDAKFTLRESSTSAILDTVTVPKTGGLQTWTNVERTITLPAGKHNFSINSINGGFNLNWFKIEPASTGSSSSSKSSASFNMNSISSPGSSAPSSAASSAKSSTVSSAPGAVSSSASSKSSNAVSSSAISSSSSSKAAVSSSSASSTSSLSTLVNGPVGLSWSAPDQRENGKILDVTELGGYELRYKLKAAKTYTYVTINDPWTSQYNFSWLNGEYVFQIAAFDKNGVYSMFSDIHPI